MCIRDSYGGGRDARVPQGGQREACVALGEAFAFGIAEQGQVHIGGAGIAEEIEQGELARRGDEQILPPDDLRNAHEPVVHDHGKLVGDDAVRAPQGEITAAGFQCHAERAEYGILKSIVRCV